MKPMQGGDYGAFAAHRDVAHAATRKFSFQNSRGQVELPFHPVQKIHRTPAVGKSFINATTVTVWGALTRAGFVSERRSGWLT